MGFPLIPTYSPGPLTEDLQGPENSASESTNTYPARAALTVTNSIFGDAVYDIEGAIKNHDGQSPTLSKDQVKQTYGLDVDGPVSQDYAEFKSSQAYKQSEWNDALARGGSSGAGNTWLGYGVSQAASFLDPIQDAASIVPIGRLAGLTGIFGKSIVGTLAEHSVSGALGNSALSAATEPFTYAQDPNNWTPEGAVDRLLGNALFGAVAGPTLHVAGASLGALRAGPVSDFWNNFTSRLQPETQAAIAKVTLGRSLEGQDLAPVEQMVGLDPRILAHESEVGGQPLSMQERATILQQMDEGTYVSPRQAIANQIAEHLTEQEVGETATKLQEPHINAAVESMQEMGRTIGASDRFTPEEKQAHVANVNDFIGKVNEYLGSQQHMPLDPDKVIQDVPQTGPSNMQALAANLHPAVDSVMDGLDEYKNLKQHKAEAIIKDNPQSVSAPTKAAPTEKQLLANPANKNLRTIKDAVDQLKTQGNSPELKSGTQAYQNELARLQLPSAPVSPRDLATSRINEMQKSEQAAQAAKANPPRIDYGPGPKLSLSKETAKIQDMLGEVEKRPAPTEEEPHPMTPSEKIVDQHKQLENAHNEAIGCVTNTI